jgi:hypothetical protein
MSEIGTGGNRLLAFLESLPVEENWIASHPIVWQTGQQNGPDGLGPEAHTHCSALVAAIALDLDIYILRPPNHAQELLANAQMDWLSGSLSYPGPSAAEASWQDLGSSDEDRALENAVAAANAGRLVIAGYRQPPVVDPVSGKSVNTPGHVVVVRPQADAIPAALGPLVTMADTTNWRSIRMANAFAAHPGAWPGAIRLFAHDTDLQMEFTVKG